MLLGNGVILRYILRGSNQPVHSIDFGTVERDGRGGLKVRSRHGVVLENLLLSQLRSWLSSGLMESRSMGTFCRGISSDFV
jgi:hypothetical protein